MSLETRLQKIEEKCNIKHRCQLVIAIWDGSEGPTSEQSDQFREHQKETGECQRCTGLCILNWTERPPRIWRQQDYSESRKVEGRTEDAVTFVVGKGYV